DSHRCARRPSRAGAGGGSRRRSGTRGITSRIGVAASPPARPLYPRVSGDKLVRPRAPGHLTWQTAAVTSRAVVLVEGRSDEIAIRTLAARRGRDLAAEGVSVLAVGGAQAM